MDINDNNPNPSQDNNGYYNYHNNGSGSPDQPYPYSSPPPARLPGNNMATAAMILGILSIVSTAIIPIYLPLILGSLAILFALLSKGSARRLSGNAMVGSTCASIGLGINVVLFGVYMSMVLALFSQPDRLREAAQTYDDLIEQMYGIPSEDIFGESMEDMVGDLFPYSD